MYHFCNLSSTLLFYQHVELKMWATIQQVISTSSENVGFSFNVTWLAWGPWLWAPKHTHVIIKVITLTDTVKLPTDLISGVTQNSPAPAPSIYLPLPLHILPPFIHPSLPLSLSVCVWSGDTVNPQLTHCATQHDTQASLSTVSATMSDQPGQSHLCLYTSS